MAEGNARTILLIAMMVSIRASIMRHFEAAQAWHRMLEAVIATIQVMHEETGLIDLRRPECVWRYNRYKSFTDQSLLSSFSEREFVKRMRVKPGTFDFLCSMLAPELQKRTSAGGISLQNRIAVALNRLGTGNYLAMSGDLYGMSEGTASIAVRDFCIAMVKIIQPIVIPRYSQHNLHDIAEKFEKKHGIPLIMGAIDGSHIPIIKPVHDPAAYYNRKGFYSVILQGIVDMDTVFWDYDMGWSGSIHDFALFQQSREGRRQIEGRYKPYKLIGDAAYPVRPFMYTPFKGSKEELSPRKAHWNFIQSSTRMCVERAFGILKGRWRILLRQLEVPLEHVTNIVHSCICLHNMCIMQGDLVSDEMHREAIEFLEQEKIGEFHRLKNEAVLKILEYGRAEVDRSRISVEDLVASMTVDAASDEFEPDRSLEGTSDLQLLRDGAIMRDQISESLYLEHLERDADITFDEGFCVENDSESENESLD